MSRAGLDELWRLSVATARPYIVLLSARYRWAVQRGDGSAARDALAAWQRAYDAR